LSGARP